MDRYQKLSIALKYYLIGKNYVRALEAFKFAADRHVGKRKDGVTPEFQHQIEIALHVTTLKDLINEEDCIIAALLHDVQEDHNVDSETIGRLFGSDIQRAAWRLTKEFSSYKKNSEEYFTEIAKDPIASIVKGCDRVHNLNSMPGVFTKEKQQEYIKEAEENFLKMLKKAADNFPKQHLAYMNIRHMIKTQISLVRAGLNGMMVRENKEAEAKLAKPTQANQ